MARDDVALALVRSLPAEVLHDLVRHQGVSDSAEWLLAATPAQFDAVVDLDLWRSPGGGLDDRFDAARFGEWLEGLFDNGATTVAAVLLRMDRRVVVAGLSYYIRVFDPAALGASAADGAAIGGYVIQARRAECQDTIVGVLEALADCDRERFDAVMRGCRRLSDSARETDGLDERLGEAEQLLHDVGDGRHERRAAQGFLTPAEARAFLRMAREPRDSSPNPIAAAYVRANRQVRAPADRARPLLTGQVTSEMPYDPPSVAADLERAFLVNTLMAGCAIQARAFSPGEANDAVSATCELGRGLLLTDPQGLVPAFQAGWAALHEVSLLVGQRLVNVLAHVRTLDSQTHQGLVALRRELDRCCRAGAPWNAREALDVLAIFDPVAWTAVLGVLDECPVVTDALLAVVERRPGAVSATAFTFVSSAGHLSAIRAFAGRLHDVFLGPF